ncbi:MAG TPA: YoaK family protein [Gaiellaceae bacterium]|nr:YoaK family protein [Gaiellaceae bacterium]
MLLEELALALAAVAGFVDVVGYLTLNHLFSAHMTGNASKLGVALGRGSLTDALPMALALVLFAAGVAVGTVLVDARRPAAALALQGALIAGFMAIVGCGEHPYYALEACSTSALGLQTAALTHVGGTTIRTSYVSGVLTNLTQGVVRRARGAPVDRRLGLLAAILVAYVAGATAGSVTLHDLRIWCLAIPLALLACAAGAMTRLS